MPTNPPGIAISGDIDSAVSDYLSLLGCEVPAIQVFTHDTKTRKRVITEEACARLRELSARIYVHTTFNCSLTMPHSAKLFGEQYLTACELEAHGVVVHIPNGEEDNPKFWASMRKYLTAAAKSSVEGRRVPVIYLENVMSDRWNDPSAFATLIRRVQTLAKKIGCKVPIGACIDTCHLYVCGKALDSREVAKEYFAAFGGISVLVHLNDSVQAFGSHLDRHGQFGENLWKEEDGGLRYILALKHDTIIELKDPSPSLQCLLDRGILVG